MKGLRGRLAADRARWDPVQRVPFVRICGFGGEGVYLCFSSRIFRGPGAASHLSAVLIDPKVQLSLS